MSFMDSLKSLKQVDFNELDVNNIGSWPAAVRALACIIIFIAVLALGYFFYLTDLQEDLERHQREEVTLKEQFTSKVRQAANLSAYKEQMVLMEASFDALLKQLPSDTEVPGLLEDITSAGLNSGLEFEEIKLQPEVEQQFYIELPIQVKVYGGYHELATFVSAVASMPRIVTLHDFSIEPAKAGSSSRLVMSILVKTYRYKDQQGAK
ncbi:type 4a pilus biogenesis protein PilO [Thiopseudomonas acetoxidans]|uniref:Type 4a pilus biogenesis protein PilO n=1 Tax=Thiopseudomonas acetoxidans TaxID=3041622 RepID=A0ABT7SKP6_9GAMM|nr:type 4a pilus biogenesis protein PilO [Thiopseudomonas sp. CY1220]MDM7856763.1 type 4a pilus biogenesis protein PilO [Thiopseudomonas sp. CY1220]